MSTTITVTYNNETTTWTFLNDIPSTRAGVDMIHTIVKDVAESINSSNVHATLTNYVYKKIKNIVVSVVRRYDVAEKDKGFITKFRYFKELDKILPIIRECAPSVSLDPQKIIESREHLKDLINTGLIAIVCKKFTHEWEALEYTPRKAGNYQIVLWAEGEIRLYRLFEVETFKEKDSVLNFEYLDSFGDTQKATISDAQCWKIYLDVHEMDYYLHTSIDQCYRAAKLQPDGTYKFRSTDDFFYRYWEARGSMAAQLEQHKKQQPPEPDKSGHVDLSDWLGEKD